MVCTLYRNGFESQKHRQWQLEHIMDSWCVYNALFNKTHISRYTRMGMRALLRYAFLVLARIMFRFEFTKVVKQCILTVLG